ncbi:histidine phosphatase family protein [bacterium]|nr:histidine phosphatase family protein [bacterium]
MSAKKTIYLIRHGETDYNRKGIIQGSGVDSDLNERGLEQAAKFYQAYHHLPFDKVYSSQLKRTVQSVKHFIDAGFPHEKVPEFNEINWGIFEGLESTPDYHKMYLGILEDWKAGLLDRAIEGGETPNQMFKRQEMGLKKLLQRENERQILVCMHGRAMRSFMCLLTGTPLNEMDQFKHSNLCLYVLEEHEDRFRIVEENSTEHLWI